MYSMSDRYPIPRNKANFCLVKHLTIFFCISADQFAIIINFDVGKLMVDRDRHWELRPLLLVKSEHCGFFNVPNS